MQDFSPDLHRRKADEIPAFVGMMGNVKTLTPTLSRWEREHLEVFPGGREDNEGARPWGAQPWGAQPCAPFMLKAVKGELVHSGFFLFSFLLNIQKINL